MPALKWLKWHLSIHHNRAFQRLSTDARWTFICCCAIATEEQQGGALVPRVGAPVTVAEIADYSGVRKQQAALDELVAAGFLTVRADGAFVVERYSEFQGLPARTDGPLDATGSDRQKRFRQKRESSNSAIRLLLAERDGAECRWCGSPDDLSVDHIVPIAKGGTDHLDNLQLLCRRCNSSKQHREEPGQYFKDAYRKSRASLTPVTNAVTNARDSLTEKEGEKERDTPVSPSGDTAPQGAVREKIAFPDVAFEEADERRVMRILAVECSHNKTGEMMSTKKARLRSEMRDALDTFGPAAWRHGIDESGIKGWRYALAIVKSAAKKGVELPAAPAQRPDAYRDSLAGAVR